MSSRSHVSFAVWLRRHRREAGISRDELAERAACSSITLQKIESGERRPSRQLALILAQVFGIPDDEREAFVAFARMQGQEDNRARPADTPPADHLTSPATPARKEAQLQSPWRSAHLRRSNLPTPLTSFVGREKEVAAIRTLLGRPTVRLLTLTGAPGIGKTRLASEVAASLTDQFEDGVFFVELAALADPQQVLPGVARTLDLREQGGVSLVELLLEYARDKRMLLVLDNFEQVLDAGPNLVKLAESSPWLKVLVTSREALHVRGERRFGVPPLELPATPHGAYFDSLLLSTNPAVRLFVERAQHVQSDFDITAENAEDVATVCLGLDGLPLAIELAAARTNLLSPKQMREALAGRLDLATKGARDLPPRHHTLRAAIEWSYDLLSEEERTLFRRLAVFSGGGTFAAAQAICEAQRGRAHETGKADVLEALASLIDKSLVKQEDSTRGEPRFTMLETIHEYAREKLEESGKASELERQRAWYFMHLAEKAEPYLRSKEQAAWLTQLEEEHANIRAALQWAKEAGTEEARALETGARIAGAIWRFWQTRGYFSEGRMQLEAFLALLPKLSRTTTTATNSQSAAPAPLRAKLLNALGALAYWQGDYATSRSAHEAALALARDLGDKEKMAFSLNNLGNVAWDQGDYLPARALYEESLTLRRELGDKGSVASSLHNLGNAAAFQGDYRAARTLYEESLIIQRELGDKWGIAWSLHALGGAAASEGDYRTARSLYEESLSVSTEIGEKTGIARALDGLGHLAYSEQDYSMAQSLYKHSLALCREVGSKPGIAANLAMVGGVAVGIAQRGGTQGTKGTGVAAQARRGTRVMGAAERLLSAINAVLEAAERIPYTDGQAAARTLLGEEEFTEAWHEGQAMSMQQAVEYALGAE